MLPTGIVIQSNMRPMKIKLLITEIILCAAVAAVSGCSKEQPAADSQAQKASEGMASEAAKAADAAQSAAKQVTDQATAQVKAADQQAQGLIDRAKALVTDQKYQEALSTLKQLASVKLTPEQQKLVDDLKAQIQSAMAKATAPDAASALGGALGGKK
jgi:hypothetical protein